MKLRKKEERYQNLNTLPYKSKNFWYIARKQDPFDTYFLHVTIYIFFNGARSITIQHI